MSEVAGNVYDAPTANLGDEIPNHPDRLFSHHGRLGILRTNARTTLYLLAMLIPLAMGGLGFDILLNGANSLLQSADPMIAYGLLSVSLVLMLPLLWGSFLLGIKRVHDCGFTGWVLLASIIPIIGSLFVLFVYLKPGDPAANRYGPPPADKLKGWEKFTGVIGIMLVLLLTLAGIYGSLTDFGIIESTLPN